MFLLELIYFLATKKKVGGRGRQNCLDGTSPCSSDSLLFGVVTDLFTHLRKLWAFAPKNARYMEREKRV